MPKGGTRSIVFATEAEADGGLPYRVHEMPVWRYPAWLRTLSLWRYEPGRSPGRASISSTPWPNAAPRPSSTPTAAWSAPISGRNSPRSEIPSTAPTSACTRYLSVRRYLDIHFQKRLYAAGGVKRVIAISEMVKADIIKYYAYPAERISVVFNSVDLDRFHPRNREVHRAKKRAELGLGEDAILLLFAGNNFRLKGLETLFARWPCSPGNSPTAISASSSRAGAGPGATGGS